MATATPLTDGNVNADADVDEPDSISIALHGFDAEIVIASAVANECRRIFDEPMQARIATVLGAAAEHIGGVNKKEVAILIADDAAIAELNHTHRGMDAATNVLAFPDDDNDGNDAMLGNIAIALGVVRREAGEAGITLSDHLLHLMVHGMLHLGGYSHDNDGAAKRMEALEADILKTAGVADPYRGVS